MTGLLAPIVLPPPGTPPAEALGCVFARYLPLLDSDPAALHALPEACRGPHLARLCREAIAHGSAYPFDKMNRWLGFVQGVLAAVALIDVEIERDATRPLLHALHDQPILSWP